MGLGKKFRLKAAVLAGAIMLEDKLFLDGQSIIFMPLTTRAPEDAWALWGANIVLLGLWEYYDPLEDDERLTCPTCDKVAAVVGVVIVGMMMVGGLRFFNWLLF
jgi:hypothetical protein